MRYLGKSVQRDILRIVHLNILLQLDTFPAGFYGGNRLEIKMCPPYQIDNQYFQHILAYQLIVGLLFLHFREQPVHMVHELVMIVPAAENDMLMIFFKGKIKPFDPPGLCIPGEYHPPNAPYV